MARPKRRSYGMAAKQPERLHGEHGSKNAMTYLRQIGLMIAALITFMVTVTPGMANDIPRFNADVKKLTGDWESEPWHFGWLRLHQQNFNEVADEFFLHLWEEERPPGLTAQQVLERSFPRSKVGDVDREQTVSMTDAEPLSGGGVVKSTSWNSQFGRYTTMFGVVTLPKGGFVNFKAQCNYRPYKTVTYTGERCLTAVSTLLESLQNGSLRMPAPEAPVSLPNWKGQIQSNGVVKMFYTGWFGGYGANTSAARSAHIYVAPAKTISAAQEKAAVAQFADETLISGFGEATAPTWNETIFSRTQPDAGEGPAIQIAMAVTNPDGRKSLVSLSCWNASWQGTCMGALERVIEDLQSGFIAEKWKAFR
jgi:hypothetical protein